MRTWRVFMASLIVAFVMLSAHADRGATQLVVTGTVAEFHAGEWISVARSGFDPMFRIALGETTTYDGSPAAIKPGVRVTVSYRGVGERLPKADNVRVLPDRRYAETAPQ